jgi:competence protein ComEC
MPVMILDDVVAARATKPPAPVRALNTFLWRAPLVPLALATSGGILLDRAFELAPALTLPAGAALVCAWFIFRRGTARLGVIYLCGAAAALAATYHHLVRHGLADDDIARLVTPEPRPARLRGVLTTEPVVPKKPPSDVFRGYAESASTRFVLRVTAFKAAGVWRQASGLVQVTVAGEQEGMRLGQEVEIAGRIAAPTPPGNPGEFDYAAFLADQGIHATMTVRHGVNEVPGLNGAITVLRQSNPWHAPGALAWLGSECKRIIDRALPEEEAAVARALLLGDGSGMTNADWDKYFNTGVIHALAISGQHLVVLAWFAWLVLRLGGVRRRRGALAVALFLFAYALLVGARPPVMRAAWMGLALVGGMLLRRPVLWPNAFALAWLLVMLANPTDIFNAGCLLSFLAVAVLYWGTGRWRPQAEPLERLIDQSRPLWWRSVRRLAGLLAAAYVVNLIVWLAVTPLAAARFHLVSPVALVIGPPIVLLTSVALLAGFMLIMLAPVCWPLAQYAGEVTRWSLAGCDGLVRWGANLPGAYWYVPDLPAWWLWGFYAVLLASLTTEWLWRRRIYCLVAGTGWLIAGLLVAVAPLGRGEFRCTFVAVGHGGCTVLETPDGRTLLYDAGAMTGPDVTRRHIAPFLWSRGIRRIDELFLSHADLDHFNGIRDLVSRFAIGQVTTTANFLERSNPPVNEALAILARRGIPLRTVRAGDRLNAGEVDLRVLHPPPGWNQGNENARSLVLYVQHAGRTMLLTGDLEGPGLERVLALPRVKVDVLMAPHHGSRTANTPALAEWADPAVVISCQGRPRGGTASPEPYTPRGARFLSTQTYGAVTLRSAFDGLIVETYRTRERWLVQSRKK